METLGRQLREGYADTQMILRALLAEKQVESAWMSSSHSARRRGCS